MATSSRPTGTTTGGTTTTATRTSAYIKEKPVALDPPSVCVPAAGGKTLLHLHYQPGMRYAFKVRTTNNDYYRVDPVFGFVEPGAIVQLEIIRKPGPPKVGDRVEVLFLPVDPVCGDPRQPFASGMTPEFKQEVPIFTN